MPRTSRVPRVPVLTEPARRQVIHILNDVMKKWPANRHTLLWELDVEYGGPTTIVIACMDMLNLTARAAGHRDWNAFEESRPGNDKLAAMVRQAIANAATWELQLP